MDDDALPTWLHTLLLQAIVSPFSGFLLWWGVGELVSGQLAPLSGPDGHFFFGPQPLAGAVARLAGLALVVLGGAFVALALRLSRLADRWAVLRTLPWALLGVFVVLSVLVGRWR